MNNLKILGTNHLQKPEEIIELIKKENPEIIGIELCKVREYIHINKIKQNQTNTEDTLLNKISKAIKKKAKEENLEYGSDMFTALQYAIDNKIPYVLVDKNIQEIQALFQQIPINEQKGFMEEIAKFEKQTIAESTIDEEQFLINLKKNFPISFEFLITLREQYITIQILKTIRDNPNKKIVIVLGKGHLKGVNKLLEKELKK